VWNGTLDQGKADGDSSLGRDVTLAITGLEPGTYLFRHRRLDHDHSNIHGLWQSFGDDDWPDDFGWDRLRERDYLEDFEPPRSIEIGPDGTFELVFDLPMPGMSLIELDRGALPAH
jgi:xylan 1,4-beta-xylosidase